LYQGLLPLLNSRRCELLDHPKLVNQLVNLERRTSRGGRDSIDHPSNAHDDIANAVAGALTSIAAPKPKSFSGFYGYGCGPIEWEHLQDRETSNAEKNGCIPGRGIDSDASLFNAQRGINSWRQ
jgi:hypothetical protein